MPKHYICVLFLDLKSSDLYLHTIKRMVFVKEHFVYWAIRRESLSNFVFS